MEKPVKTKQQLLREAKREQELAKQFNRCMQLMNEVYKKHHSKK